MNRLGRVSWITWRIYFWALPVNIFILAFSVDHELKTFKDIYTWALIASISHIAIIPIVYIGIIFSKEHSDWKVDLIFLIIIGAFRGVVITILSKQFSLPMVVSDGYKIFNSAIGLPLWFFLIASFVESRRIYQSEFKNLFYKAIEKERTESQRKRLMPNSVSETDESVSRLQYLMNSMQSELNSVIEKTDIIKDFSKQADVIDSLIKDRIKTSSKEIWLNAEIKVPTIPFFTLLYFSMLRSRLRVLPVIVISIPYLFVGLHATTNYKTTIFQCILISLIDLSTYKTFEILYSLKLLTRIVANIFILICIPFIFYIFQEFLVPEHLSLTSDNGKFLSFNVFLNITFPLLVLVFNSREILKTQRSEVLEFLRLRISDDSVASIIRGNLISEENKELAEYLHGEIQAGLTASSILLQRAAAEGDEELAQEALERAAGLLSQDHQNISYTRMATPEIRIQKIIDAWKGIADITINLPNKELLSDSCFRNSVSVIEEAITNAIRHGQANNINVSAVLVDKNLVISIIYPGLPFQKGNKGLGSQILKNISEDWQVRSNKSLNTLTISLRNEKD